MREHGNGGIIADKGTEKKRSINVHNTFKTFLFKLTIGNFQAIPLFIPERCDSPLTNITFFQDEIERILIITAAKVPIL